jgi:hypothetical protein
VFKNFFTTIHLQYLNHSERQMPFLIAWW